MWRLHADAATRLADAIVSAGVTSITGSVVGDSSRYDGEWYPPTWSQDIQVMSPIRSRIRS